ncbi:MAG: hypothetical protein K2O20_10390, partial [Duncaniella sp.]|nr:hypothetical protein [Duncaniella sp.]
MFSEKLYETLPPGADRPLSPGGRLVCWALVLLAALTYALFSFYVPYIGDDYALVVDYMTANGGSGNLTAAGFLKFVSCFREIDNGRLDNFIFVVMRLACAKWLLAAVVGLSASVMIWAAARLVSPVRRVLPFVIMAVL